MSLVPVLACTLLAYPSSGTAATDNTLFSDDGYRISDFRSPVPDTAPSAVTVSTAQVQSLLEDPDTLLIDVLPTPIKPKDRPANLLWLPPARYNIPGSIWLPNVGFGALSKELERYFKENLDKLSAGNKEKKIILYCLADCWMSWNAAKRAATEYGYSRVYWYPAGSTGWEAAGFPLKKCEPVPMEYR